jgi:hypothetical protein
MWRRSRREPESAAKHSEDRLSDEKQPSSTPNLDDLQERVESLAILLADPQPGQMTWMMAYSKAATRVQEFFSTQPPGPGLPFVAENPAPKIKKSDPNRMTLCCPFCGQDPLTLTMRFSPIPEPPAEPLLYLITHGCSNLQCAHVINTQLVPADWIMVKMPSFKNLRA